MKRFAVNFLTAVIMAAASLAVALQFSPLIFIRVFAVTFAGLAALRILAVIPPISRNRLLIVKAVLCLGIILTESVAVLQNGEVRAEGDVE